MCGIAVALDWPDAERAVRDLAGGLVHRGDVTDPIVSPRPNTAMCTRRLRIVDGEHGRQPQLSWDGRILVAFNGEIYNHRELRGELIALGARFSTDCDTEVLAAALSVWGGKALQRFIGMYAFVALDLSTGSFLAARDPLGVKPLYLVKSGAGHLFCSEIKPLLDATETGEVLLLPPGYFLAGSRLGRFTRAFEEPAELMGASRPEALDAILAAAVERRVPPDLPFATMFSGGIDSTLVTHYARRLRPEAPGYFLGGPEAPDYPFALQYADQTGLDLRLVDLDEAGLATADMLDAVTRTTEAFEPSIIRDSFCTYLLSRRIHQDGFRVTLVGEGADELFAGYLPLARAFAAGDDIGRPVRGQCLAEMNRSNLQRVDRCTMRFQLEARLPFLDAGVVAYALGLHGAALVGGAGAELFGKAPLRRLYDLYPDALPPMIRDRRKLGLNVGSGLDASQAESPWITFAEAHVSDADFADGVRRYGAFDIQTKEELLYIESLGRHLDLERVPHLQGRHRLVIPDVAEPGRWA